MKKILILSLTLFLMGGVSSCKKYKDDKEKEKKEEILFSNDWVNQNPSPVEVSGYLWNPEVLEFSFRENSKGCGWGSEGSGKTIENQHYNGGDTVKNVSIDWGFWQYAGGDFVKDDNGKVHNFPSELQGTKPIAELWATEGQQRFYILNIEETEVRVVLMYISGVGTQVEWYYSPVMTFTKK